MAELILNNVCKTYGQQDVVSNLNLEIPDGAFTALLGPSGCGKTTTLRMIAGLERLSRGMLTHGNRLLDDGQDFIGAEQRKMGMVFQSYALWPHMTVTENVAYPLKLQGIKGAALKNAVTKMLDLVALGPYAERRPDALSGGQRQRVALARCLIAEPEVVLLDEPLANLDRHLRATMEDTFRELHRRTGTTFVFVTHDQAEAMALASQIAVLKDGQLVQAGRPDEIYQKPQNRWVAEFIGKGSVLTLNPSLINSIKHLSGTGQHNHTLVRPEHVHLNKADGTSVNARVDDCVFLGERYHITLTLDNCETMTAYSSYAITIGSHVGVSIGQAWLLEAT